MGYRSASLSRSLTQIIPNDGEANTESEIEARASVEYAGTLGNLRKVTKNTSTRISRRASNREGTISLYGRWRALHAIGGFRPEQPFDDLPVNESAVQGSLQGLHELRVLQVLYREFLVDELVFR